MYRKLSPSICALALAWFAAWPVVAGEEETAPDVAYGYGSIPKIWIGVRLSETPEALAAHVRHGKFMLINIAEGSPADQAGLDQYDVVVSFNDRTIEDLRDLLDAIQENGADKPGKMVVIHRGAEKTVTVTPRTRDLNEKPVYKFQEDELVSADPFEKYFGHRLKIGPNGKFIFEPQGRLDMMPDDVKTLLDRMQQFSWHDLDNFSIDPGNPPASSGGAFDQNATVRLRMEENGVSLSIQRAPDGKITIERQDAGGDAKTVEYENEEQLRNEDPEAYEFYERTLKPRGFSALIQSPDLQNLDMRQYQFQKDLQEEMSRVQKQVQQALEESRQSQKDRSVVMEKAERDGAHTNTVTLAIKDGKIRLKIDEDGAQCEYEFDSREAFRKSEPELYEKYKQYLDDAELGARFPTGAQANTFG